MSIPTTEATASISTSLDTIETVPGIRAAEKTTHQAWVEAFISAAWLWADESGHCSTFDSGMRSAHLPQRPLGQSVSVFPDMHRGRVDVRVTPLTPGMCVCPRARRIATRHAKGDATTWEVMGCRASSHERGVCELPGPPQGEPVADLPSSLPGGTLVARKGGLPMLLVRERNDGTSTVLRPRGIFTVPTDVLTTVTGPPTPDMAALAERTAQRLATKARAMSDVLEGERAKRHTARRLIERVAHSQGERNRCDQRLDELLERFGLASRPLITYRTVRAMVTMRAKARQIGYLFPGTMLDDPVVTGTAMTEFVIETTSLECDCAYFDAAVAVKEFATNGRTLSVEVLTAVSVGIHNRRGKVCTHPGQLEVTR